MSNLYATDDGWGNEWASQPDEEPAFASSSYLNSLGTPEESNDFRFDENKVPDSFKFLWGKLHQQVQSVGEFETLVLDKLVEEHQFTSYQRTKLINTLYDQSLTDLSSSSNFYQALGLVSLELDLEGTGDYVTLQFKIADLPPLPSHITDLLTKPATEDPLTEQLNDISIKEDTVDPVLTDHSTISKSESTPAAVADIKKYIAEYREMFKPLHDSTESIHIKEIPEKEGLLFKHVNYTITHNVNLGIHTSAGPKKVIRRYSDFVWLLEFLLKKYPFRVIPGLPPKKFTGASPDSQFLQRRRRGLYRFLNQLIKHPILRKDPVVISFLSVPTDLTNWKKQAQIDYSLEFKGVKIQPHFMSSIWPVLGEEFLRNWLGCEHSIAKLIEYWTKIVILVERYERRQQQIAADNNKFVEVLSRFHDTNNQLYPHRAEKEDTILGSVNKDDMNAINSSITSIADFFTNSSQAIVDETFNLNTSVLEKFKNYLDYLYSLLELFERSKRLLANTIGELQIRIKESEAKFTRLSNDDADIKASELAKLKQTIINDKQEMFQQLNKDWLIKECCLQEYLMFQETQYLLSELWIDWSRGRAKFQGKMTGLYEAMNGVVSNDMPLHS